MQTCRRRFDLIRATVHSMTQPISNLTTLLRSMEPVLREGVYAYVWTDEELKRVGFVPYAKACVPDDAP